MTYPQIIQSVISGPSGKDHFGFKNFQLEDYARGALHDGLVLGHDTGGGKSLALFTWPALTVGFQGGQCGSDWRTPSPAGAGEGGPNGIGNESQWRKANSSSTLNTKPTSVL